MMKVAVRVQAAVFGAYALRLDTFAAAHLARVAWWLACNRLATGSASAGLAWFALGLLSAPKYCVERPPVLQGTPIGPAQPSMELASRN
jgi:hypothetical protein